ncbi:MAG TPA: hypothetical protein VKH35_04530 [Thermoanaerobaculia bacterium]|jgi:hypothetical protein|nr:hypothetical protein [Thermoanaerobaculia bacterium]
MPRLAFRRIAGVLLLAAACHRDSASHRFVQSLRCGMDRAEVARIAAREGYDSSDAGWMQRSTANERLQSKELMLVDLTFREGKLTAVREGTYDPRTKRITYRSIDLCRK